MTDATDSYRLPRTSRHVMAASCWLTSWGLKAVWIRLLELDGGPEGAFISDASLAQSLGLDAGTAKNYRFHLRSLGLARTFPRPGARQYGWVMQLPEVAIPGERETHVEVRRRAPELAKVLDVFLASRNPQMAPAAMQGLPQPQPPTGGSRNPGSPSSTQERGVGGRTPPSVVQSKAQLLPAVTQTEEGVVAKATRARKESEQLGMPEMELRVVEGGQRSDNPTIRAAMDALADRLADTA